MAKSIQKPVGDNAANRPADVQTVQQLLNQNIAQLKPTAPLAEDGKAGQLTVSAIRQFQARVVGMQRPDGVVDPGGQTLSKLNSGATAASNSSTCQLLFEHGNKKPPLTSAAQGTAALYESRVTLSGSLVGSFRGSIYPDDLAVKGRLVDGQYSLYLGFHHRKGHKSSAKDLVVRNNGFRAALIVNADMPVKVVSNNPNKTTSQYIHVHNGFQSKRYSDGCPTIHPSDWPKFIQSFLDAYPIFGDWTSQHAYLGKHVGTLVVRT